MRAAPNLTFLRTSSYGLTNDLGRCWRASLLTATQL